MPFMKSKNLLILFVLFFIINRSTAQVIFSEGFENTFPASGWSILGSSGQWTQLSGTNAYSGNKCIMSDASSIASNTYLYTIYYPLTAGINYRLSYWYKISQAGFTERLQVGINSSSNTTTLHDYPSITNTTYQQGTDNFTVPSDGYYRFYFYCYSASGTKTLFLDSLVFEQTSGTMCTGTPSPGVASSSAPPSICPDSTFQLSLGNLSTNTGIIYKWQSSPMGENNFTDINNGTTTTLTVSQDSSSDYRCKSTCFFSGQSSYSNIVSVTSPKFCYCIPPPGNCTGNSIDNVTFAGINNSSGCTVNGYTDYTTGTGATVAAGSSVPISVTVSPGTVKYVTAMLDSYHDGTMVSYTSIGNGAGTTIQGTINIPIGAYIGETRIRIRARTVLTSGNPCTAITGETEDYKVTITPYVCTGTPTAGVVGSASEVCSGVSFPVSIAGTYIGYTLQWESSPAGANNFLPIAGGTTQSITVSQAASTDYRCKVTCPGSGLFVYSGVRTVNTPALCYCSGASGLCIGNYFTITRVVFGSIDNSSSCGSGNYIYTVAPATVNAGTSVPLNVTVGGAGNLTGGVGVWIDYNQNGILSNDEFTEVGYGAATTLTKNIFIPSNALPGTTRMRIRSLRDAHLDPGNACTDFTTAETEDYMITINGAHIAMYFTPFTDTLYSNAINITARIVQRDLGLNTTTNLKPRVWAKKENSSTWKSFPGQLLSGNANDGNWQFAVNNDTLGVRKNSCDSIQFYFVAQDINTPFNVGYLPEQGALHTNVNTQVTPPTIPFGYRLKPRFRDTVFVSNGDCRFKSLSAENGLFQEINSRKLEGDMTVVIESDLVEDGTYELTGDGLNGHHLIIRPSSNTVRTISASFAWGSLITLNAAKNVTIDGSYNGAGRYFRFLNGSTSASFTDSLSIIELKNSCDSITIKNSTFQHTVYATGGAQSENGILLSQGNQNVLISNNLFGNMTAGNSPLRHIVAFGNNHNVQIRQNEFRNFVQAGVLTLEPCDHWIIDSNHFYRDEVLNFTNGIFYAINTKGNGHVISNNYIGGQAPYCAGAAMNLVNWTPESRMILIYATDSNGVDPVIITKNHIDNINAGTTTNYRTFEFDCIAAPINCVVSDNVIGNGKSTSPTIVVAAEYIFGIGAGSKAVITNNSVSNIHDQQGSGLAFGLLSLTGISCIADNYSPVFVSGNKVFNLYNYHGSTDKNICGISIGEGKEVVIEKNNIYNISANAGTVNALAFGNSGSTCAIRQNRIYSLGATGTPAEVNGIYFSNPGADIDVYNNQVSLSNSSQTAKLRGIREYNNSSQFQNPKKRIIYNSVYIGGTSAGTAGSSCYFLETNDADPHEIRNNIFYNDRSGGSYGNFIYDIYSGFDFTPMANTKLNQDFYSVPDTLLLSKVNNTNYSWTGWRNLLWGDDTSYVSKTAVVPSATFFTDKNAGNLDINASSQLCWQVHQKGLPVADINTDFAGGGRSTDVANGKTDIGADEFITSTLPPDAIGICPGGNNNISSNIAGAGYQWQVNTGSGYTNISNNANYNGATTATLQLINIPSSWYGYKYRCFVNGTYSNVYEIRFVNYWTGAVSTAWEVPGNWSCGTVPDSNTDVVINAGTVVVNSNIIIGTLFLGTGVQFSVTTPHTVTIIH